MSKRDRSEAESTNRKKDDAPPDYGPNAWLIEEMRERFEEFPDSVGDPWRAFLSGRPEAATATAPP
ncbi:hypothetical protein K8I85_14775, partial [bacterium]|nr:hypothetical protein [bacterium]